MPELEAREQLLAHRLEGEIHVVQVNGHGVGRLHLPESGNRPRQEAQHAADSLEVAEGRELPGERVEHVRVQRIRGAEGLHRLRAHRSRVERRLVLLPERAVGVHHAGGSRVVHPGEEAPPEHVGRLVVLGGVEERRLPGRHALQLLHDREHRLVLVAIRVERPAVLADGESVDERRARRALHGLEERGEEGGELVAGRGELRRLADLAEVDRELVQQDQRRLAAEQLAEGVRPRRHPPLVARPHALVARLPGQRVGDLTPRGERLHPVAHRPAVQGVGVLAVERGHPHGALREERRLDELLGVCHPCHPTGGVDEGDEAVRLAAAELGIETEDGRRLTAGAAQATRDVGEEVPKPARRVRVLEEARRVPVLVGRGALYDLGQVGREVGLGDRARQHVRAWRAEGEDGGLGHAAMSVSEQQTVTGSPAAEARS